jgi:Protein of unknown function (DUF2877)
VTATPVRDRLSPSTRPTPGAASSLLAGLLDRTRAAADLSLVEVVRTRVAVHYETGDAEAPLLCVATPAAVRLPNTLLSAVLPGRGPMLVSEGRLRSGPSTWWVARWWHPPRPSGLVPPDPDRLWQAERTVRGAGGVAPWSRDEPLDAARLVGAGPGLTPCGDDFLAGALVAAYATADARLEGWQAAVRRALRRGGTTAVSQALLHHAMGGYATPELAGYLVALCQDVEPAPALRRLLGVGHTSGAALAAGVLHTLATHEPRGAG